MKILGIQEYSMCSSKWLDKDSSISWLRAFEELVAQDPNNECHALLCEPTMTSNEGLLHDGIMYHFVKVNKAASVWISKIKEISPDVILTTCFPGPLLDSLLQQVSVLLPSTKVAMRLPLSPLYSFRSSHTSLANVDTVIVPMEFHEMELRNNFDVTSDTEVVTIPFGADSSHFTVVKGEGQTKTVDVFTVTDPTSNFKNFALVNAVSKKLTEKGYIVENLRWLNKQKRLQKMRTGKVIYCPSLVEASGGSVLIEGVFAGLYPIVDAVGSTSVHFLQKIKAGTITHSGSYMDMYKQLGYSDDHIDDIVDHIVVALESDAYKMVEQDSVQQVLKRNFSREVEIEQLIDVLLGLYSLYSQDVETLVASVHVETLVASVPVETLVASVPVETLVASVPSGKPSNIPSGKPSNVPSVRPQSVPLGKPSNIPSGRPSNVPLTRPPSVPVVTKPGKKTDIKKLPEKPKKEIPSKKTDNKNKK